VKRLILAADATEGLEALMPVNLVTTTFPICFRSLLESTSC
jgi:hypothetical protein